MSEDRLSVYDAVEERGFFFYSGANGDLCRKNGLGGWRLSIAHSWLAIQKKNKYGRWKTKFKVEDADVLPGGRRDGVSREQKLRFLEKVDELLEKRILRRCPTMSESRHVASLVATHGLPEDMDLLVETLQEADGVRVNRIDGHYADIVIDELGEQ